MTTLFERCCDVLILSAGMTGGLLARPFTVEQQDLEELGRWCRLPGPDGRQAGAPGGAGRRAAGHATRVLRGECG